MRPIKKISFKVVTLLQLLSFRSFSQDLVFQNSQAGFNIGVNCAFGTHVQRIGLTLNFYYVNDQFQANSEVRGYFSFKNLGPKMRHPELVLSQGVVFAYGPTNSIFNPFISSVSNQTGYSNAIAYSYNAWFNKRKTSQQTGIVSFQFDKFSLITENDILARPMFDRFRTAAFLIQYQYEDLFQAAINCSMWTGEMGRKKEIESAEFYYNCYIDTSGGTYANISHGLLSAQVKYHLGYSQNVQANVGIDAEQIRNAVQNKFIHDMRWIPKKWKKAKNCHIPMIDTNGDQYLYRENQKIRPTKPYLNVFTNANLFY